jgi:hypothetical protein
LDRNAIESGEVAGQIRFEPLPDCDGRPAGTERDASVAVVETEEPVHAALRILPVERPQAVAVIGDE